MPGEKNGEAFHLSAEEKKPAVEPDNDGLLNHLKNFKHITQGSILISATKNGMKTIFHLAKQKLEVYLGHKMNQIVLLDTSEIRHYQIHRIDWYILF